MALYWHFLSSLERHQHYYTCLRKAQEYREKQRFSNADDEEPECLDDDVLHYTAEAVVDRSQYEIVLAEFYTDDVGVEMDADVEPATPVDDASPIAQLLRDSIMASPLPPDQSFRFTANATPVTQAQVKRFQQHNQDITPVFAEVDVNMTIQPPTTAVTVDTFERAIRNLAHDPMTSPSPTLNAFASIRDVSSHFRLNYLQHVAFTLIAVLLLRRMCSVHLPSHQVFDDSPIIITGAAGTGKSRIVGAVRALVSSWNQPAAVSVVAPTGIAASSLQGSTMHSSVGLGIDAKVVPNSIKAQPDALLQTWAPVVCVIADELSMIDLALFGVWEESLQYAKDTKNEDYGGLLTVLMFDHCQLRTVTGLPMYKTSTYTPAQTRGCLLYRKITKVVYLTENMRFWEDTDWG